VALGYGVANFHRQFEQMARAAEQALHHSRLAGQRVSHLFWLDLALVVGPRRADEALDLLDRLMPADPPTELQFARAWLLAMLGRFDEAWPIAREAHERARDLNGLEGVPEFAEIATLAGNHELAAEHLRLFCDYLEKRGQPGNLSYYLPRLGRSLCALGRIPRLTVGAAGP
jgi:tetratricopeptide (TPR) repeat protein